MGVEADPFAIQAKSYSAELTRRGTSGFMLARGATIGSVTGGVVNLGAGDLIMSAPVSGMSVNVATGECIVPGSSSTTQGGYYLRVSATTNLAIAAANATNPRIDLVCATVNDAAYTGAANSGILQVVTGTPTSGATLGNLNGAPSLPTSSLLIGYVLVPANATNIISGDLGDHRAQLALASGLSGGGEVATGKEVELTTTGSTTIVTYTPTSAGNFWIAPYFRVTTATTAVTVTATWTDVSGSQTLTMLSAVSEVVGSYAMVGFLINSIASNAITVSMTAGTANQVYGSASILQG